MIDTLHTENAPEAIGPYSQAKSSTAFYMHPVRLRLTPQPAKWKPSRLRSKPNRFAKISARF